MIVPSLVSRSTVPSTRRSIGAGWPALATVRFQADGPRSTRTRTTVANRPLQSSRSSVAFTMDSTSAGEAVRPPAVRTAYRTAAVNAAASTPLPQTSPITRHQLPSPTGNAS